MKHRKISLEVGYHRNIKRENFLNQTRIVMHIFIAMTEVYLLLIVITFKNDNKSALLSTTPFHTFVLLSTTFLHEFVLLKVGYHRNIKRETFLNQTRI